MAREYLGHRSAVVRGQCSYTAIFLDIHLNLWSCLFLTISEPVIGYVRGNEAAGRGATEDDDERIARIGMGGLECNCSWVLERKLKNAELDLLCRSDIIFCSRVLCSSNKLLAQSRQMTSWIRQ